MKLSILPLVVLAACSSPPPATEAPPPALTKENFLEPAHIREAVMGMDRIFATRVVPRSGPVFDLLPPTMPFGITYELEGKRRTAEDLMAATDGTGLLVLHGDRILHESYGPGAGPKTLLMSMS